MRRAHRQSQGQQGFSMLLNPVAARESANRMIPLVAYAKEHLYVDSHASTSLRDEG